MNETYNTQGKKLDLPSIEPGRMKERRNQERQN